MDKPSQISLSAEAENFIKKFLKLNTVEPDLQADNEKTISSVLIYEKFRVAVEYQEEHLVFKNAISRILRRKYTLQSHLSSSDLTKELINELSWANYINPESLDDEPKTIEAIIDRYLVMLKYARSGHHRKIDLQKMIIDWMACEIDETLRPNPTDEVLIDYVCGLLRKNLDVGSYRLSEEEIELQLKIAIYSLLLKPDYALIQYWTLRHVYKDWLTLDQNEIKKIAKSFDPYFNKVDRVLNHKDRRLFIQYAKRSIAPFILLHQVLLTKKLDLEKIADKPAILQTLVMEEYRIKVEEAKRKVWRGTFRALIFIFITKISLAFILEMPFDRFISGTIDYLSLVINVSLPPLLMLIAGTFVKSPPIRNYRLVSDAVHSILTKNVIESRPIALVKPRRNVSYFVFNFVYSIFSLAVIAAVIWLLLYLKFNIVSITLFFIFVSIVSFFSFRIRNIALELAMKRTKNDALTTIFELAFLPFIRIGKYLSDQFAAFNPLILALDFLIEAPLKTIIKIVNSWLKFINAKKEELEL